MEDLTSKLESSRVEDYRKYLQKRERLLINYYVFLTNEPEYAEYEGNSDSILFCETELERVQQGYALLDGYLEIRKDCATLSTLDAHVQKDTDSLFDFYLESLDISEEN